MHSQWLSRETLAQGKHLQWENALNTYRFALKAKKRQKKLWKLSRQQMWWLMLLAPQRLQITTLLLDLANMWKFSMGRKKRFKEPKCEHTYLKRGVLFSLFPQSLISLYSTCQPVETKILSLSSPISI